MDAMGLKGEDNFRTRYLRPAQKQEFIAMLYPDSLHASNQAYYLTSKGLDLLKKLKK